MSRRVWPHAFLLHLAELTEAVATGRAEEAVKKLFPESQSQHSGMPIALRWSTTPLLGFPRQPFEVWRRPRTGVPTADLGHLERVVEGDATIEWGGRDMFEVTFHAEPAAGRSLTIVALDRRHEVIPGQRLEFNVNRVGRFVAPGIASLRATGEGVVHTVEGIDQIQLANAEGWQRIEVVGLPFNAGTIELPLYDPRLQGLEPPALAGYDAARRRLEAARLMHLPLPTTGVADIPTPSWPAPDPALYLQALTAPALCPRRIIRECLENSVDADPTRMQVIYEREATLDGIRQADLPGAAPGPDSTHARLPVVAVTMLAVASDSSAATGLGYGTIDFPPPAPAPTSGNAQEPPGTVRTAFYYMVTADFVVPFVGRVQLAALGYGRSLPERPANLRAATLRTGRAPARDAAATAAVQLSWDLSTLPQAFALVVSERSGASRVLNARRLLGGGFDPFIPSRPPSVDGEMPVGARTVFTDPVTAAPLSGASSSRYLVIGLDVFGRWSSWRMVTHTLTPPPLVKPGLHGAAFIHDVGAALGHVVPSTMEIEFSWDWTDRAPDRIEFSGRFVAADAGAAPAPFTAGFALTATLPAGPRVVVGFDAGGAPSIRTGPEATVEALAIDPAAPDRRKYRLTVEGMSCDFSSDAALAYAVFARSAEAVRAAELSPVVGPRIARTNDPVPPAEPTLPIDLAWTALSDARGCARGVLAWTASASAAGYVVWEATESALRNAVDPELADPTAGTTLVARAAALRSLITASAESQSLSLRAFSRVNTALVRDTRLEIELPAGASTIYAYRVSAVSSTNQESARSSTLALFAVPKRNVPGQPRLLTRTVRQPRTGIDVIAVSGPGAAPAGYRIHRVRLAALAGDVGTMGPPIVESDDSDWREYALTTLRGTPTGEARAFFDQVPESWHPYYYRIVAIGLENLHAGEYAGESIASAVQQTRLTPSAPPLLELVSVVANETNQVVTCRTDLPVRSTPIGRATIDVVQIAPDATGKRMSRSRLLSVAAHGVPESPPLGLIEAPTPAELAAMPEITRNAPDADGRVTITVRLGAEIAGVVVVTDPLGRSTERQFPESE